jgi:hypothetical protein
MKFMQKDRPHNFITRIATGLVIICILVITACTTQQYYEGLKAGQRANCLKYPDSEYDDCIDETNTEFEEYKSQRKEVVGN